MKTPRILIFIIYITFFFFSSIALFFIAINLYDQNCFLNIVEKKATNRQDKIQNDYHVLNMESKIESKQFLDLITYLGNNNADAVYFNLNFSSLSDSGYNNEIKEYIKTRKNIFAFLKIDGTKGLKLFDDNYLESITKNLIYIKTNSSFLYAHYKSPLKMDNTFSLSSENIGFTTEAKSLCDADNIDLVYKLDNKYLFNLAILNYCRKKNVLMSDIIFGNSKAYIQNNEFRYDQKGRMGFIHDFKKPGIAAENFQYWKNSFSARAEAVENLKLLNIIKTDAAVSFAEEDAAIDNIYNIANYSDVEKNTLLDVAKNKASLWKSFKESTRNNISKKKIIIVENGDFGWISNFILESNMIEKGLNVNKIPIALITFMSFILLFIIAIMGSNSKKSFYPVSITIILIIAFNIIYFVSRIFLNYDFPFVVLSITCAYSLFLGLILRNVNYGVWLKEVREIYRSNISASMAKNIVDLLKNKKWNFDSKQYITTFLSVDTGVFLQKEFQEDDIETVSQKTTEIENVIKNNNGIIDSVNAGYISSYFGNPPLKKDHALDALKVANMVSEVPLVLNNSAQKLRIAVHARKEWFKYQEKYGEKYYSHFGNSYNILTALIKIAAEFEVDIIISDAVYKLAGMDLPVRMFDRIKIKGLKNSLRVFELLSQKQADEMSEMLEYFHAGLKLFEKRKWEESGAYFRQCLKIRPNDVPSTIYLQRCKDFIYVPPLENWDGSYEVD